MFHLEVINVTSRRSRAPVRPFQLVEKERVTSDPQVCEIWFIIL